MVNKRPDSGATVGLTASVDISVGASKLGVGVAGEGKLHARDTANNSTSGQYLIIELKDIIQGADMAGGRRQARRLGQGQRERAAHKNAGFKDHT